MSTLGYPQFYPPTPFDTTLALLVILGGSIIRNHNFMRYPDFEELEYIGIREVKREGRDWFAVALLLLLVIGLAVYMFAVHVNPDLVDTNFI